MTVLKDVEIENGLVRVNLKTGYITFWADGVYGNMLLAQARDLAGALATAVNEAERALSTSSDPEGDAWEAEQNQIAQARIDAVARVEAIKNEPFDAQEVRLAMMQLAAATGNLIAPGRLAS